MTEPADAVGRLAGEPGWPAAELGRFEMAGQWAGRLEPEADRTEEAAGRAR